ncbi:MAG: hypothetical protein OXC00_03595 [Acidimicrobiaceae bacterium]|nr:hypothetical protein [Acidimicrobiaceae bacterium]
MTDSTPDPKPVGPVRRVLAIPGRTKLLIAVGVLLVVIFGTQSCQGVDVSEEQATATARSALAAEPGAFEPSETEAKVLRQGFPPTPVWVVVFTVADPEGGSEDFLRHAAVWVDAQTGSVRQVTVDRAEGS